MGMYIWCSREVFLYEMNETDTQDIINKQNYDHSESNGWKMSPFNMTERMNSLMYIS